MSLFDDKFDEPRSAGPSREEVSEVAAREWDIAPSTVEPLVGGFRSAVFRAKTRDGDDIVLRAARRTPEAVRVEAEVMSLASDAVPVPRPFGVAVAGRFVVIAMEFVDAQAMDRVLPSIDAESLASLGARTADVLASLREVRFEQSGFFGEGLELEHRFEHMGEGFLEHMRGCLDSRALRRRLDDDELQRLTQFLEDHAEEYRSIHGQSLTHSDFNLKNILVHREQERWELTAVIDWEFSFSGHPLVDAGNMLRFEAELPAAFVRSFSERFVQALKPGDDWRWKARLLDLTAIVQFLTRPGRFPKTTRTARKILDDTLNRT